VAAAWASGDEETPAKSEGKNSLPKPAGDLFGYLEKYD
jgi:hypothetical protein